MFLSWHKWQAEHNIGLESGRFTSTGTNQNTETSNNWKTYKNTKYGYLFMHPDSLQIDEGETYLSVFREGSGGLIFEISIKDNSTIQEIFESDKRQYQGYLQNNDPKPILQDIVVDGLVSKETVFANGVMGTDMKRIYINKGKNIYVISLPNNAEMVGQQILSTLKLTLDTVFLENGQLNTKALEKESNWKTYVNSNIGIQFKYPILNISNSAGALKEQEGYPGVSLGEASFTVEKIPSMSAQSWFESKGKSRGNRVSQLNQTLVNGQRAYNLIVYSDPGDETIFLIEKDSNLYLIYSTLNNELLTKMLTTFEFIK